ncbi:hypothetical protein HDA43_006593 [Streptosporangium sandarakinum]|uniref:Uncharacterized protein n=1 Tax=Streptosporangium sandarakinum TaxID=1260955 RepID=A0A852V8F2_9ACTN|nr:hypothetical protein [Streptosporangium sandarakinum]NYF44366.1 hypothetical protein [Streptosporangium sandarakinum]
MQEFVGVRPYEAGLDLQAAGTADHDQPGPGVALQRLEQCSGGGGVDRGIGDRTRHGVGEVGSGVSGLVSADQDVQSGQDRGDAPGIEDVDVLPDDVLPLLVDPGGVAGERCDVVPPVEGFGDDAASDTARGSDDSDAHGFSPVLCVA